MASVSGRPKRVRSEVVLRRFMAGESVAVIALDLKIGNMRAEAIIRRALNKPRSR